MSDAWDAIIPDALNANEGTERGMALLRKSMQSYGVGKGLVLDADGEIIAGNKTAEIAAELGFRLRIVDAEPDEVIAVRRADLDLDGDDPAARNLATADNRVAELNLHWSDVMLAEAKARGSEALEEFWFPEEAAALTGEESAGDDDASAREGLIDDDAIPEDAPTRVQPGDLWALGDHRLLCGDSQSPTDLQFLMGKRRADLVYTDPPYGVDYDGGAGNEKKREKLAGDAEGVYGQWMQYHRHFATDTTPFYIWFADTKGRTAYDAVEDAGLKVRAVIVWHKLNAHYGAFMRQYMQKHELCLYCHIGTPRWYGPTNEVTVWDVVQPSKNEYHPTQKPVELAQRAIKNSSQSGDLVLDLFGGSGSTLIGAHMTGRVCYMMELSPTYCDVIVARWEAFTGDVSERIDG